MEYLSNNNISANTIIADEIIILKVLLNNFFCKSKYFLFCKQYKKIKTPIQVEMEVANGIIKILFD